MHSRSEIFRRAHLIARRDRHQYASPMSYRQAFGIALKLQYAMARGQAKREDPMHVAGEPVDVLARIAALKAERIAVLKRQAPNPAFPPNALPRFQPFA